MEFHSIKLIVIMNNISVTLKMTPKKKKKTHCTKNNKYGQECHEINSKEFRISILLDQKIY